MKQSEQWVIFYTDGRTFDWRDGGPWDAPRTGVGLIVVTHPERGYQNIYGSEHFYYEPDKGGFQCCLTPDDRTLHEIRAYHPLVLFGEMMDDLAWRRFLRRANRAIEEQYGWRYEKQTT